MNKIKKIRVNFNSANQVAEYYLPFFNNGGFFFATEHPFALNDDVILSLTLPDGDSTPIDVEGKVSLIVPKEAQEKKNIIDSRGVGVSLIAPPSYLQSRINALLRMHQAMQ